MSQHADLLVETITNGPFAENCYLAADANSREALLIDPGDEEQRILERVRELDLVVRQIVCTHGHIDHAGAVAPLKRMLGVPFAIHPDEMPLLRALPMQAAAFGLPSKECPEVDQELADGQCLQLGQLTARVLLTPGHSPGGCCLHFESEQVVIVGDTLFAGSIGRTDLPGGETETLLQSIRQRLLALDDANVVYSGHGPPTTIGAERRDNPFLKPGPF
jgi:hydroxyacylglutathione hydrolase